MNLNFLQILVGTLKKRNIRAHPIPGRSIGDVIDHGFAIRLVEAGDVVFERVGLQHTAAIGGWRAALHPVPYRVGWRRFRRGQRRTAPCQESGDKAYEYLRVVHSESGSHAAQLQLADTSDGWRCHLSQSHISAVGTIVA